MAKTAPRSSVERAARVAGLRSFRTPTLEAVEQRRLQLWVLTVLLLLALAVALLVLAFRPEVATPAWLTPRAAQLSLLVLISLFCVYAIEKELQLRRLTALLVAEKVLTAELTGRVGELTALLESGRAINLDLELDEVLERILRGAVDLLDGRDASIMLAQGEDELATVHAVGRSGARGARVRVGEGIAGRVAQTGEPLLIHGKLDHGDEYLDDEAIDPPAESAMSTPLLHRGRLLGVINLNASPGRRYTEHDLRALALFGEQAAVAVANAQLFEAQRLIASQSSYRAQHDPLTRLPNRDRFLDRVRQALAYPPAGLRRPALLFLDLDDFKRINDSLGHAAGDQVLVAFAERLRAANRAGDTISRFGGDEFALLVEGVRSAEEAAMVAEGVLGVLDDPFAVGGREIALTGSMGIALSDPGGTSAEELLHSADVALHAAKERGKGGLAVFSEGMRAESVRRLDLESELRRAVERSEIEVHYQPIFALADRRVVAAEALLRWRHPDRGLLPAGAFVSFAEQIGVLRDLDLKVLSEACALGRELSGPAFRRTPPAMNVNLLPTRLDDPDIVERVAGVLSATGLEPGRLVLEITERAMIAEAGPAGRLSRLCGLGVRLALDDFGTGYSSLSHLRRFPVYAIKIDRTFTDGLDADPAQLALVRAIVKFGHRLGLLVIAEGVERPAQVHSLRSLGCSLAQGFELCGPLPATDLLAYVAAQRGRAGAATAEAAGRP